MIPYVEPDADAAAADPDEDPELAPESVALAPEGRNGLRQTGQELFSTSQGLIHASWNLCSHGSKIKLSPALKSSWHTEQPSG